MDSLKLYTIKAIDWFDSHVLRHSLYERGLCEWILNHPWWGDEEE